jgi:hypothetical protein
MNRTILFFLTLFIFAAGVAGAQSPYLSVVLRMDSSKIGQHQFTISMKLCRLRQPSPQKDAFSYELSKTRFDTLTSSSLSCGDYIENGGGYEYLTGKPVIDPNVYRFGNQAFAYEVVMVFKIEDSSSAAAMPMYVVFPVRHKSFVTSVSITDVSFRPGKVLFVDGEKKRKSGSGLRLEASVKKKKAVEINTSPFKSLL